jgi:hypothetical protein
VARATVGRRCRHVVVVECHVFLHLERRRSALHRTLASEGSGKPWRLNARRERTQ